MHLSSEKLLDCAFCEHSGTLSKMLGKPHIHKTQPTEQKSSNGNLTKKYIEDNREILNQQKKEATKKTYE